MNPRASKQAYRRYLVFSVIAGLAMVFTGGMSLMRHGPYDTSWGWSRYVPWVVTALGVLLVGSNAYRLWKPRNPRPLKFEDYHIT